MTSQRCEIIKKLFSIQNAINLQEKSFNYCTVSKSISGTWTITTFRKIFAEDYVYTYLSNNFRLYFGYNYMFNSRRLTLK